MIIEHTITINAPIATVWALTTNVEAWPSIMPTVTSVELLESAPVGLGSQAKIKQPGQRLAVWTVNAFRENREFAWSTKVLGTKMTGRHQLFEVPSGTQNTLTIELVGPLANVLRALTGRAVQKAITTENESFKRAAESSP